MPSAASRPAEPVPSRRVFLSWDLHHREICSLLACAARVADLQWTDKLSGFRRAETSTYASGPPNMPPVCRLSAAPRPLFVSSSSSSVSRLTDLTAASSPQGLARPRTPAFVRLSGARPFRNRRPMIVHGIMQHVWHRYTYIAIYKPFITRFNFTGGLKLEQQIELLASMS